ncbi:phage tail tape measure protein [Zobellia laminariae]|uniref:DUF7452 domain-containing protein n=1 Tax=Zobellia laminariae TaxID=248906 RepID=UPI0012D8D56B|nr:hypothetical protein [Zobellia laminariae]
MSAQKSYGSAFVHTRNDTNTVNSNTTFIDNLLTNNMPEKALFINNYIPGVGQYNNHPIGVRYLRGKWWISNLDGEQIPKGSKFNVLVLPLDHPNVYIHKNRNRSNIQIYTNSYDTRLRHPKLDNNPNARFIVSQQIIFGNTNTGLIKNTNPVGVYYKNGYWYIFNKNKVKMPRDCVFNIYINDDISVSKARDNNTDNNLRRGYFPILNDSTKKAEHIVFATQRSISPRNANENNDAIWYWDYKWQVQNLGGAPMPIEESYNVFKYELFSESPRYRMYTLNQDGWTREHFEIPIIMNDPSSDGSGRPIDIEFIAYDADKNLVIEEASSSNLAIDSGYLHERNGSKNLSKFIQNRFNQNIGLLTISNNWKVTVKLDYDLNGQVDHMAIHDGVLGKTTFFVLETEEALRNFEELLNGRNTFCQMGIVNDLSTGTAKLGIGAGTNPLASILGCGNNGLSNTGSNSAGFDTSSQYGNSKLDKDDFMDNICKEVSANGLGPGSGLEQIAGSGEAWFFAGIATMATGVIMVVAAPVALTVAFVGGVTVLATGGAMTINGAQEIGDRARAQRLDAQADYQAANARALSRRADVLESRGDIGIANAMRARSEGAMKESERLDREARSERDSPTPGPEGQPTQEVNWPKYCENRARMKGSYGLDSLEKGMAQMDCPSPLENVSGIALSVGGGGSGPGPKPIGPYQPNLKNQIDNELFCQNHNEYPTLGSVLERVCSNPVAQPGNEGEGCGTITIGTAAGTLDVGALDIIAPQTAKQVKKILDQVVNPGIPFMKNPKILRSYN